MLHIKVNNNKAKIVLPRKWQMVLDLETGERTRIDGKPFPCADQLKDRNIARTIEGLFNLYEITNLDIDN